MRTFIAIDLPDPVRAALAKAQESFRGLCSDARWTRPEGIHLTLKFLGEISGAQVAQVSEVLLKAGSFAPFSVEIAGFGFFPSAKRPRVFWTGVAASHALTELAASIETQMEKLGFAREERGFSPHLTLARFKDPRPQPELSSAVAAAAASLFGKFEVSEFFLFESKLSAHGAQYGKVMSFQLAKIMNRG